MHIFVFTVAAAIAATSIVFYMIAKRLGLCKKTLIFLLTALDCVFCLSFPLLFALISGKNKAGAPALGFGAAITVLALWFILYLASVARRVALRSSGLDLKVPVPEPDQVYDNTGKKPVYDNTGKKPVDSAQNIDKMDINTANCENADIPAINALIERAFECLDGGKLEEAAGFFYEAIVKRPPLELDIQIAIQLGMVYSELGRPEFALDVLYSYMQTYRGRLSGDNKAALGAAIDIIETAIARK